MSTRGAVAWRTGRAVKAIYNHDNSFPTYLGKAVHAQARQMGLTTLVDLCKRLTDWREVETDGICRFCGKLSGQPHSISGILAGYGLMSRDEFVKMRAEHALLHPRNKPTYDREISLLDEVEANKKRTGYPDPEAKWHQHNGTPEKEQFDPFNDPLYMEWVYVLCPEKNLIAVWIGAVQHSDALLSHYPRWSGRTYKTRGSGRTYTHVHIRDVRLDEDPDWAAIEAKGEEIREQAERLAEPQEVAS